MSQTKTWQALASGLAGWAALVLVHEIGRRAAPNAPRLDILNQRAVAHGVTALGIQPPTPKLLAPLSMVFHLVAHTLLYSSVGLGRGSQPWVIGPLAGLVAGLGAALLPLPMGLGSGPTMRSRPTQLMTVLWHLYGGLTAAGVYSVLKRISE